MSKTVALYHIVFCTKWRENTISLETREHLYRYIWSIVKNNQSYLLRIGGTANHVHACIDLHPTVALAQLIQQIKSLSSGWMLTDPRFRFFKGWAHGYYAASLSPSEKDKVVEYIKNQDEHHLGYTFDSELAELCGHSGITLHANDLR